MTPTQEDKNIFTSDKNMVFSSDMDFNDYLEELLAERKESAPIRVIVQNIFDEHIPKKVKSVYLSCYRGQFLRCYRSQSLCYRGQSLRCANANLKSGRPFWKNSSLYWLSMLEEDLHSSYSIVLYCVCMNFMW